MPITLDRDEAISILEEIARNGQNGAARIAALKELHVMRAEEQHPPVGFEGIYDVEVTDLTAERRRRPGEPAT